MRLVRRSSCKVNLLLNVLGERADGFHELETVIYPVPWFDELEFASAASGIELTCNVKEVPVGAENLVVRAAAAFFEEAKIREGVRIRLEKRVPLAAGLGGGSSNAACALLTLNELFGEPLSSERLHRMAGALGSDVPFFLQPRPVVAVGRGERISPLEDLSALRGATILLVYPGFGVPTAWAYRQLSKFPVARQGKPGRARDLVARLQSGPLSAAASSFYNSLEAPAFFKYPMLRLLQEHLQGTGAIVARMSGSGSTLFALTENREVAQRLSEGVAARFGERIWRQVLPLP